MRRKFIREKGSSRGVISTHDETTHKQARIGPGEKTHEGEVKKQKKSRRMGRGPKIKYYNLAKLRGGKKLEEGGGGWVS